MKKACLSAELSVCNEAIGGGGAVMAVTQWEDENYLALMDSSRRTAYTAARSKIDALSWASEASSNGQVDGEARKGRPARVVTSISQPVCVCVWLGKERRDRQMLSSALHAQWGFCYDCKHERGLWPPSSLLLLFSGSLGIRHRYTQTYPRTHTHRQMWSCADKGYIALTKVKHHLVGKITFHTADFLLVIPGSDWNLQRMKQPKAKWSNCWWQIFTSTHPSGNCKKI